MMGKNSQILMNLRPIGRWRAGVVAVAFRCSVSSGAGQLPNIGHRGARFRPLHAGLAVTLFAAIGVLAAACNLLTTKSEQKRSPNIHDQVEFDRFAAALSATGRADHARSQPRSQRCRLHGSGHAAVDKTVTLESAAPAAAGEGYDLNFENAPVTTVAKVILGDILSAGYIIDPRVQGTVTLASGRPVPKATCCYVLESALRTSGVALVRDGTGYRLVPSPDAVAPAASTSPTAARRSRATASPSCRCVMFRRRRSPSCWTASPSRQGAVRARRRAQHGPDPGQRPRAAHRGRNHAELRRRLDEGAERSASIPVRHCAPEPIITEIERIMDSGDGGLSQNLVKLQPIARLNAILVVASKPELLKTAQTWISAARQFGHRQHRREGLSACATATRAISRSCSTTCSSAHRAARSTPRPNQLAPGAGLDAPTTSGAACAPG